MRQDIHHRDEYGTRLEIISVRLLSTFSAFILCLLQLLVKMIHSVFSQPKREGQNRTRLRPSLSPAQATLRFVGQRSNSGKKRALELDFLQINLRKASWNPQNPGVKSARQTSDSFTFAPGLLKNAKDLYHDGYVYVFIF